MNILGISWEHKIGNFHFFPNNYFPAKYSIDIMLEQIHKSFIVLEEFIFRNISFVVLNPSNSECGCKLNLNCIVIKKKKINSLHTQNLML